MSVLYCGIWIDINNIKEYLFSTFNIYVEKINNYSDYYKARDSIKINSRLLIIFIGSLVYL